MSLKEHVDFDNLEVAFAAKNDKALKKLHFIFSTMKSGTMVKTGTFVTKLALKSGLPVKGLIKRTLFDVFCGGETIDDCQVAAAQNARFGVGSILDYSVEGGEREEGFDRTTEEIVRTLQNACKHEHIPFGVFKVTGLANSGILTKMQAGEELSATEQAAYDRTRSRVDRICSSAYELGVRVMIDAEESWFQNVIDDLAYEMMEKYNKRSPIVFNTYQMYRQDMLGNLRGAFRKAVAGNFYLGAKLVRGAYMEKERERAFDMGYESPIHTTKEGTDESFNNGLKFCMDNKQRVFLVAGSHNEYSNYYLTVLMDKHSLKKDDDRVYFAQLYGMSDHISFNLAGAGYNVAKYLPYGPIKEAMPYLFRRAEENTSVKGQSGRELSLIKKELERRKVG